VVITLKYTNEHPSFDSEASFFHINAISDGTAFKLATVLHIFHWDAESWQQWRSQARAYPGPGPGNVWLCPGNPIGKYEFKSSLIKMNTLHYWFLSTMHAAMPAWKEPVLTLLSKDCLQCEARRSHPRNWKMKAKNLFRASPGVINATPLYELPSAACNSCARGTSVSWLRHCVARFQVPKSQNRKMWFIKDTSLHNLWKFFCA